jgi:hypothetical protein
MKNKTKFFKFLSKSIRIAIYTTLLTLVISSKSYSQSAYSTPKNYGNTIDLTETARYLGGIQREMQLKYEKNFERLEDKYDDIYSAMISAKKRNNGLTQSQANYYNGFINNYNKILKSNLSDTVYVNSILGYMRSVQEEVYSW